MIDQIIIHRRPDCYESEFLGPHAATIRDLFGTCVITTAYTSVANAQVVRRAIHKLNPGVQVDLCDCCRKDYSDIIASTEFSAIFPEKGARS